MLARYLTTRSIYGSFYSNNADMIFLIGSGFGHLDPIRIEFIPEYSASANTP